MIKKMAFPDELLDLVSGGTLTYGGKLDTMVGMLNQLVQSCKTFSLESFGWPGPGQNRA